MIDTQVLLSRLGSPFVKVDVSEYAHFAYDALGVRAIALVWVRIIRLYETPTNWWQAIKLKIPFLGVAVLEQFEEIETEETPQIGDGWQSERVICYTEAAVEFLKDALSSEEYLLSAIKGQLIWTLRGNTVLLFPANWFEWAKKRWLPLWLRRWWPVREKLVEVGKGENRTWRKK